MNTGSHSKPAIVWQGPLLQLLYCTGHIIGMHERSLRHVYVWSTVKLATALHIMMEANVRGLNMHTLHYAE